MTLQDQALNGLLVVLPNIFKDNRGTFVESYHQPKWSKIIGRDIHFLQQSEVHSYINTVRGLHFQAPPHQQEKIITVITGTILDVAVDIRKQSPTYGKHFSVVLSGDNKLQFFIPRGFAHGYSVLAQETIIQYQSSSIYMPSYEHAIYCEDEHLDINWEIPSNQRILSEKDQQAMKWQDFQSPF